MDSISIVLYYILLLYCIVSIAAGNFRQDQAGNTDSANVEKSEKSKAKQFSLVTLEQEQSYECLNRNGYDQDKCALYFDNYNTCKKFWGKVFRDRKAKGMYPYLPEVDERAKIKSEYMKSVSGDS